MTAPAAAPAGVAPGARSRMRRAAPHGPVVVLAAGYAWYFARLSVAVHDGYGTFGFDLGIFDQGVWLLSRFHAPFVTVMGRDLFGDHTSFILLLAVPLYWVHDAPQTLLVLQAILLGGAALPIYALAATSSPTPPWPRCSPSPTSATPPSSRATSSSSIPKPS
jgi:hypothetical protein